MVFDSVPQSMVLKFPSFFTLGNSGDWDGVEGTDISMKPFKIPTLMHFMARKQIIILKKKKRSRLYGPFCAISCQTEYSLQTTPSEEDATFIDHQHCMTASAMHDNRVDRLHLRERKKKEKALESPSRLGTGPTADAASLPCLIT